MERREKIILEKVLSEIEIAGKIIGTSSLPEFLSDELLKRAACMTVINIGELVKNLPTAFRMAYPAVPWKEIAGFRDIAAHKYQTLRMEDVFETITVDFPALHQNLKDILEQEAYTITRGLERSRVIVLYFSFCHSPTASWSQRLL